MRKGYKQLLAEADAQVTSIEASQAIGLHGDDGIVFVDLREQGEREREGVVPGAFSCPRGLLEFWIDPESPYAKAVFSKPKRFVFFCAAGWRSALAAKTAQDMGLENVAHVAGGFGAWKAADGPIEPLAPAR